MDIASFIGFFGGITAILVGLLIEGGGPKDVIGVSAAIIVVGGTLGAVVLQFPPKTLIEALMALKTIFLGTKSDPAAIIRQIVDFARRARREGILALEKEIPNVQDPFFAKALSMAVDGLEPKVLYETMETEMTTIEEEWERKARVWEAYGGYAPTVGIIGAVLGLIQVMKNLSNIEKVGEGIAVAFIATVYGVGTANLIALPFAGKLKAAGAQALRVKEMTLKGVLLIQEGINHSTIEEELKGFLDEKTRAKYASAAAAPKE
jgi:chemotaxis protein MotA